MALFSGWKNIIKDTKKTKPGYFWHAFHPTPLPNVALESHKENKCFGLHCPASPVALRFWPGFATISHKNHQILTPNARYLLLRVRRQKKHPAAGKQHGLAGSTDPFLTCISPRPAANCALESHKENKCFGLHCPASPVALRFWPGFATISHKNHQILTPNARYLLLRVRRQKKHPAAGKQHGLAGSTDPFLTYMSPHPDAKL